MQTLTTPFKFVPAMLLALGVFTGCESSDSGSGGKSATTMYYGVGIYDPWYYGGYDDDPDIVVTPPRQGDQPDTAPPERPERPERPMPPPRPEQPIARPEPRPEQPIARPTPESRPSARPMPSIPSAPRPSPRR